MRKALLQRNPPINASKGMIKAWFAKHRAKPSAAHITGASSIPNESEHRAAPQAEEETPGDRAHLRIWETAPAEWPTPYGLANPDPCLHEQQRITCGPKMIDLVEQQRIAWQHEMIDDYPERRGIALSRWRQALEDAVHPQAHAHAHNDPQTSRYTREYR